MARFTVAMALSSTSVRRALSSSCQSRKLRQARSTAVGLLETPGTAWLSGSECQKLMQRSNASGSCVSFNSDIISCSPFKIVNSTDQSYDGLKQGVNGNAVSAF